MIHKFIYFSFVFTSIAIIGSDDLRDPVVYKKYRDGVLRYGKLKEDNLLQKPLPIVWIKEEEDPRVTLSGVLPAEPQIQFDEKLGTYDEAHAAVRHTRMYRRAQAIRYPHLNLNNADWDGEWNALEEKKRNPQQRYCTTLEMCHSYVDVTAQAKGGFVNTRRYIKKEKCLQRKQAKRNRKQAMRNSAVRKKL